MKSTATVPTCEHERVAQVGLQEDDRGRRQTEAQERERVAEPRPFPDELEGKGGQRNAQQHLGELGGLELEIGQLDPAVRAARCRTDTSATKTKAMAVV